MERKTEEVRTYPKYVLSRKEFKDKLGITEPGNILDVTVSFYKDTVEITLSPDKKGVN
jgi:hypothetical protein